MDGLSASDVALMQKDTSGWGGGSFFWIFALIVLVLCFGGFNFGGRQPMMNGQPVTETALCNAMNFNGLENNVGRAIDKIDNAYTGMQNGLSNFGYETLRNFSDTQKQIADVRFEVMNQSAIIQKANAQELQNLKDTVVKSEMERLQSQLYITQLNQALCGVVRYPNTTSFCAGMNPFFGSPCQQTNI